MKFYIHRHIQRKIVDEMGGECPDEYVLIHKDGDENIINRILLYCYPEKTELWESREDVRNVTLREKWGINKRQLDAIYHYVAHDILASADEQYERPKTDRLTRNKIGLSYTYDTDEDDTRFYREQIRGDI